MSVVIVPRNGGSPWASLVPLGGGRAGGGGGGLDENRGIGWAMGVIGNRLWVQRGPGCLVVNGKFCWLLHCNNGQTGSPTDVVAAWPTERLPGYSAGTSVIILILFSTFLEGVGFMGGALLPVAGLTTSLLLLSV